LISRNVAPQPTQHQMQTQVKQPYTQVGKKTIISKENMEKRLEVDPVSMTPVLAECTINSDGDFVIDTIKLNQLAYSRVTDVTLSEMAKSLGKSVIDWASKGFKIVTDDQFNQRVEICKSCTFWNPKGFNGGGSCTQCGCSTQAKLRMATASCPLNPPLWGQV